MAPATSRRIPPFAMLPENSRNFTEERCRGYKMTCRRLKSTAGGPTQQAGADRWHSITDNHQESQREGRHRGAGLPTRHVRLSNTR